MRVELVREDQRQVWVLTRRGHGEAKKLLEPKGISISALREEKYDPDTGQLLGTSYDDHTAAVTSTATELHRAGIGHRLGFQTEIGQAPARGRLRPAGGPGGAGAGGGGAGAHTEDSLVASRPALAAETGKTDGWWVQAIGNASPRTVDLYVTCG
ncbi:hypothetical protein [Streptomyces roseoviridis]|uniref:Uncharacterized protein n=1 Tax=Streptomyces roseoviridis TaxID=67361 RepID=A0ABV5QYA8_9ACTN